MEEARCKLTGATRCRYQMQQILLILPTGQLVATRPYFLQAEWQHGCTWLQAFSDSRIHLVTTRLPPIYAAFSRRYPIKTFSESALLLRYRHCHTLFVVFVARYTSSVCSNERSSGHHRQRILSLCAVPSFINEECDCRRVRMGQSSNDMPVDSSPANRFRGSFGDEQQRVLV